ncbi:two-component system response regulator [Anaerobacillus isosaccharinicus]|uniref:EAL domain-containing protein n=1 Tax=Anaerobacillus isosaccharinicus TaxID=1532552 RepID=A0A1S2KX13_9BACI|nr:EAL domain-containing response regulator [Anaerobacillus isosaccharinicus]MBA5587553.1 EAL domain-containing protein [Anaerobacillus isosaccharinicus]QOY34269.1 EAL domain-containing protein [Anaerobacillus isosaccharinicus]
MVELQLEVNPPMILVVDDRRSTRLLIRKVLQKEGYKIVEAENGQEALEIFNTYKPAVILLDIVMPVMDGLTACKKIRRMPGGEETPILMFTGKNEGKFVVEKAFQAGANDFITKPINWEELKYRVLRMLQIRDMYEKIQRQYYYDSLTGLPNRLLLQDRLAVAINQLSETNEKLAIIYLTIKNFNLINDAFGYEDGDLILKAITERLLTISNPNLTITRVGLANFPCIIKQIHSEDEAAKKADEIIVALSDEWTIRGQEIYLDSNIGISLYPNDGNEVQALLQHAEIAMVRASELRTNSYCFYNEEMNSKAYERISLENALRTALTKGEFVLFYQPKILSETDTISGVEVLIRWRNEERGLVPPGEFIPVVEENGMIIEIGEWVLRTACKQVKTWLDQGFEISLSVNVSSRQFYENCFVSRIEGILLETQFPASLLTIEITESIAMKDINHAISCLEQLKGLNVQISIDDFGTGYSSLSYLNQLPLSELKIDRSFIENLANNGNGAIIDMILALGRTLNLNVVAEGVETIEQKLYLKERNCREMQGFLFSKPIPINELEILLKSFDRKDLKVNSSSLD